jgi:hypothetical protein
MFLAPLRIQVAKMLPYGPNVAPTRERRRRESGAAASKFSWCFGL